MRFLLRCMSPFVALSVEAYPSLRRRLFGEDRTWMQVCQTDANCTKPLSR